MFGPGECLGELPTNVSANSSSKFLPRIFRPYFSRVFTPKFTSKIVSIPLQFHMFEPNIFHSNPLLAGETKRLHVWSHLTEVPNHVTLPCKSFLNPQEAIKKRGTSQSGHLDIRSEKLQNESSPNFFEFSSRILPRILLRFFPEFFVLRFVGNGDQKKITKNPRHFSMQNSHASIIHKMFLESRKSN